MTEREEPRITKKVIEADREEREVSDLGKHPELQDIGEKGCKQQERNGRQQEDGAATG